MNREGGKTQAKTAIREADAGDADAISQIYNHYVRDTVITFEEEQVTAADFAARIAAVREQSLPWLLLEDEEGIRGYAYATGWKGRSAYRFSVEVSVYLQPGARGCGYGRALYDDLLERLRLRQIHAAIGGITLPNDASVALHERCGFHKVAHFAEVGFKFGRWLDVGYWQRLL